MRVLGGTEYMYVPNCVYQIWPALFAAHCDHDLHSVAKCHYIASDIMHMALLEHIIRIYHGRYYRSCSDPVLFSLSQNIISQNFEKLAITAPATYRPIYCQHRGRRLTQ